MDIKNDNTDARDAAFEKHFGGTDFGDPAWDVHADIRQAFDAGYESARHQSQERIEAAIAEVENPYSDNLLRSVFESTIDKLRAALCDLEVKGHQAWVPVTERLPEIGGDYNVTYDPKDGCEPRLIVNTAYFCFKDHGHKEKYIAGKWYYIGETALEFDGVVAWMSLPEPFHPEEKP